ncbi:serpin family protein [Virgibacillus alimentarius]|uniref:Serpin B n=1 Tax=Virgibacillus alimentarius TaxID=698769 RepID=A0ABS4S7S6_9BACI|nr:MULTISPECIES: serpin family protein [Virgibacillus]MBP2257537.1 serpin B [Virgibacillus alimentarius]HLR68889.1 serpin family protein [Virgibacillus sp.]
MKRLAVLFSLGILFMTMVGCSTEKESSQHKPGNTDDIQFNQEDYKEIIPSNNELGFNLFSELKTDEYLNTFISPTSLFLSLSMLYNGAHGVTQKEIAEVLGVEDTEVQKLNEANASLMSIMDKKSNHVKLFLANAMWLNEDFQFQEDFVHPIKSYFHAEANAIDIHDTKSADKINNWVKNATNDKIEQIADKPLNPDLISILTNAIYFKGSWTYPFDQKQTKDGTFHLSEKSKKDVSFMKLTEDLEYLNDKEFQAVSLPYGEEEMSMKVFLPKKNSSLKEFEEMLSSKNWKVWNSEFQTKKGTIILPKFQIDYETSLNKTLQQLGMESAFNKDANFSRMIQGNDPVWIGQVKQKTYIDVNEEGTEASAATSTEMETTSAPVNKPFQMKVNRPFFIAITDDETGAILFIGSIYQP